MRLKVLIPSAIAIGLAFWAPLAVSDLYLKFKKLPSQNGRLMLLGGGSLQTTSAGIRSYTPSSTIRHIAVYGNQIEYDYVFRTDKYGFRKTYQCESLAGARTLLAIGGDSFTEGQGAQLSWTSELQSLLCKNKINSINTATAGSGLLEMERSLAFAKNSLGASKAIIAIIPDDIYRPHFNVISSAECSMYEGSERQGCGALATWWHIQFSSTSEQITSFAEGKQDYGLVPAFKLVFGLISSGVKEFLRSNLFSPRYMSPLKQNLIESSADAVNRLRSIYGVDNLLLLVLPTKKDLLLEGEGSDEVRRNDFSVFLSSLARDVQVVDVRDCDLQGKHFYELDSHPNDSGQELLGGCVVNALVGLGFLVN